MRRGGRVHGYIVALLAAGLAAGAAAQVLAGNAGAGHAPWVQAPLLLGVLCLASHLIIRIQARDDVEAIDLFEAVLAPVLVVFPGLAAVGIAVAAKAIAGGLHRNEPTKAWFNVAQWAAATGAGSLVLTALRTERALTPGTLGALGVAMLTVALVNYAAFTGVVSLATRRSPRAVLADYRRSIAVAWFGGSAVNVAFGVLFTSAYLRSPFAVVVMVVPLAMLHWGSRGFATARTDRVRLQGLQAATHALAGPIDPRDALPRFLTEVQRCFEADAVDLYELTPAGPLVHRVRDVTYAVQVGTDETTATRLAGLLPGAAVVLDARRDPHGVLEGEGWRVAAAAPVRTGEKSYGALCVYNRGGAEGFEQGEVVVLEALANEVASALAKAELLDSMLEERRQLADIVGNTSDGILTLDERGRVTSWNAGLTAITGYDAEEMLARGPDMALRARDEHGVAVELAQWPGGPDLPASIEVVTATRQSRWLSCTYTRIPPRDGRGPQLVVMARDVTKSHELDKLKDDFVAHVSHELRTPLAPIKGWSVTLLKRGDELSDEQRREGARAILRQADRLEQLILNILEDSRVESEVNTAPVDDVIDVTSSVGKVLEDFAIMAPERVVTLHGADDAVNVVARAVRVEQILANLVANAVKYSPKNEPIEVTVERGPGAVLVSVTDHGPGIPPEHRERIFERFERLSEHSLAQTGTGLGLYIARRLATSMGGELVMTPATGGGSTFTLRLQAVRQLAAVG